MDTLISEIKQGIERYSKERQASPHPSKQTKQNVLTELLRLQGRIPELSKQAAESRNRESKKIVYELDTQLDDEIIAWENIIAQTDDTPTTATAPSVKATTTTAPSEKATTTTAPSPKATTTTAPSANKKSEAVRSREPVKRTDLSGFRNNPIKKPPEVLLSYWDNLLIELELGERGYFLSLYDHTFTRWYENASTEKDSMPFIIGLIGDTHVGKSAMIEPLLKSLTVGDMKKMIIEKSKMEPKNKKFQGTSANVSLFSTDKLVDMDNTKIYILDMEGTSANSTPSILEQGLLWMMKETPPGPLQTKLRNMLSDPVKRNTAVGSLFPPLAYLVCDMIVFISTDTFDNSSYIQRVSTFTKNINIQASDQPALVLISNKVNVVGSTFEDVTKKFYALETKVDGGDLISVEKFLQAWYSSVNCICLPNWNEAIFTESDDSDSTAMVSIGVIKFIEQIGKLKRIIVTEIQNRKNKRNSLGQHLSEKTLLATLKHFLKHQINFDQTKRLLDYYNFTISNVTGEVNLVFRAFEKLLSKINKACDYPDNVIRNFNKICEFAMIYLAIHISLRVRSEIDTIQHVTDIADPWKREAKQLINLLNESQLCFSHITYQLHEGNLEVKKNFRCTNEKKRHNNFHYSNQQLFTPDAKWNYIQKCFTSLLSFFGIGYYPRWEGNYKPHGVKISNDLENYLENSFEKAIVIVFEKPSRHECLRYAAMIMKSITDNNPIEVSINVEDVEIKEVIYCSICFEKGKKLCSRCQTIWDKVEISEDWQLNQ